MKKLAFALLFFSFYVMAEDSIVDQQYKKEIENAKKLNDIFDMQYWTNVKFKNSKSNAVKNFNEFTDFEKNIYVLIVAENTSRSLGNLEKSWQDKIKSNENFENLPSYIANLHAERKTFYNNYLKYAQSLVFKFKNNLTEEEAELIVKQIKDFSKKENLD